MTNTIINKIKEILLSTPLDIYSEENESVTEANYELVSSRFDKDSLSLEDRYIGSANIFIAASLVCYDYFECQTIEELTDQQLNEFYEQWRSILEQLKAERFIRDTKQLIKSNIKMIVDNTKLL
jgi:hypothetical protein